MHAEQPSRRAPRPVYAGPILRADTFVSMSREQRRAWVNEHGVPKVAREPGARRWLVAPIVAPLIERLSRGPLGWCFATASALRTMAFVDTGYLYGERSIPRFIHREVRALRLRHKRMPPGTWWRKINKGAPNGTQLNRYANEAERREALWRAKMAKRQERQQRARMRLEQQHREREAQRSRRRGAELAAAAVRLPPAAAELPTPATREQLARALAAIARPPAPTSSSSSTSAPGPSSPTYRERVDAELARARAWAAAQDDKPKPPKT